MIKIETQYKDLFYKWLTWLSPVIEIEEGERKLLAAFITLHYFYSKRDYNQDTLNQLLFSDETKEGLRTKLQYSKIKFTKAFNKLNELNLIKDGKLHHLLTRYPKDGNFKIVVDFKIVN